MKHVGRIIKTRKKCVVAYRVIPSEPDHALVVLTENLMAEEHDALIKAVESSAGQDAYEFGEAMARNVLPDGRNMLAGFHTTGKIRKVESKLVEMTPDNSNNINLADLNKKMGRTSVLKELTNFNFLKKTFDNLKLHRGVQKAENLHHAICG